MRTIYVMCLVHYDYHEFTEVVDVAESLEGLKDKRERKDLPLVEAGSEEETEVATGDGYSHYSWEAFTL